jgi:hypothetical protein
MAGGNRLRPRAWSHAATLAAAAAWVATSAMVAGGQAEGGARGGRTHPGPVFQLSTECMACHNGLTTAGGEDISIGVSWRASMMANSSRDPYWRASVRRETLDHPLKAEEIEDECAACHMPMARALARMAGRGGRVFAHAPGRDDQESRLAEDGVSCTLCHQIGPENLGTEASFVGGFVLAPPAEKGGRSMFGPYDVDAGRASLMRSATGVSPVEARHLRGSELCATCHTLITKALGPRGEVVGSLPEQVPYQEWRHSAFRGERSCQSCHMPAVAGRARVSSVLGELREGAGRHTFLGGNFFMLRMLNRHRAELGVEALPQELEASARATLRQLETETATLAIGGLARTGGRLVFEVAVGNATGHKLPTGYPSRRAWLHVTVRDRAGAVVFESGALTSSGLIAGNDHDTDAARFEPHHTEIRSPEQVQVYESVMADARGLPTTGLLRAVRFAKDNRLLPRGFDKASAPPEVAVLGDAAADADFLGGGDRVRFAVEVGGRAGPLGVEAELRFQPIGFRWAENLRGYDAPEPRRFVAYFTEAAGESSAVLARARASEE